MRETVSVRVKSTLRKSECRLSVEDVAATVNASPGHTLRVLNDMRRAGVAFCRDFGGLQRWTCK